MVSLRKVESVAAMNLLLEAISQLPTANGELDSTPQTRPYDAQDVLETADLLEVMEKVELLLAVIYGDVLQMVDIQNDQETDRQEVDRLTREMEVYLLKDIRDLEYVLAQVRVWFRILTDLEEEYKWTPWNDPANEHHNFLQNLDVMFNKLKRNTRSKTTTGTTQYLKALNRGLRGVWQARALARRQNIEEDALPLLAEFMDLVAQRIDDREKTRIERQKERRTQRTAVDKGKEQGPPEYENDSMSDIDTSANIAELRTLASSAIELSDDA